MFLDDFRDTFKVVFQPDPEQNLNKPKTTNQSKIALPLSSPNPSHETKT